MACEEGIVGNASKDVSLLLAGQQRELAESQRQLVLAEKRLPLGGWTCLLMLLSLEQTGAFILVGFLRSTDVNSKKMLEDFTAAVPNRFSATDRFNIFKLWRINTTK